MLLAPQLRLEEDQVAKALGATQAECIVMWVEEVTTHALLRRQFKHMRLNGLRHGTAKILYTVGATSTE